MPPRLPDRSGPAGSLGPGGHTGAEIFDTAYVVALTGYGHDTVLRWVGAGKLTPFCKLGPRYLYSKETLLDFFLSDSYNRIPVKSQIHIRHIKNIK